MRDREIKTCCPRCDNEITIVVTYYSAGYPPTRDDPGDPGEVEWEIKTCTECGLDTDKAQQKYSLHIEEIIDEHMNCSQEDARDAYWEAKEDR